MRKKRKTYEESHAKMRKRRRGHRRTGIDWEWNSDGQFFYERIKGYWKRYWKRYDRRVRNNIEKGS